MKLMIALIFCIATVHSLPAFSQAPDGKREFFELRTYHFKDTMQERKINDYLQYALVPALRRVGLDRIGVFTWLANDTVTDKRIYLLIPIKSLDQVLKISSRLKADSSYQSSSRKITGTVAAEFPYTRFESVLLRAFSFMPRAQKPALASSTSQRVYELRSYESATETLAQNKIEMFNEGGEIALFKRLGFNAIFYGEVISGSQMPNLMYMTSFENRTERDNHWKAFGGDPEWKKLSSLPQYKGNVSHIDIFFLRPTTYSDL